MNIRLFLSNMLLLIYRTRELSIDSYDGVMHHALENVKINNNKEEVLIGTSKTQELIEYIVEQLEKHEVINLDVFILRLDMLLENDPKLLRSITSSLLRELTEDETKGVVTALVGEVRGYVRELELQRVIDRMSVETKFKRQDIPNLSNYVRDRIGELEPLAANTLSVEDPALVREVNFSNTQDVISVFDDVKKKNTEGGVFKTGFQGLNRMCQGGFRPGEFVTVGALQHKYKTGLTLSLFMQLATLNEPIIKRGEENKKPLILRISLEDSVENNFQFMYQYLKANSGVIIKPKDLDKCDTQEMGKFIISEMSKNGFDIIMRRIDPSKWTFSDLFSYVLLLESQGFSIQAVIVDYLTMLPTTGCTQGPAGTDKRDLIRRVRNFMSAKEILFITPLQLSTEAKQLTRAGVPDVGLLREVSEKGYYADSRQLDQEIDLELYCHLASNNGVKYLCLGRGKHRGASVLENEKLRYIMLPFPQPNVPVLEDVFSDDTTLYSLPRAGGGDFGASDDILGEFM